MRTVILAAGDFPRRGGRAWEILVGARRVVACDSAAVAYRRRFHRWPDVVIGDMDSAECRGANVIRIPDQDTNDLTKAIRYAKARGWRDLVAVGATGRREDHMLGNLFRALDEDVPVVTESGTFHPVVGTRRFAVRPGAAVSVFAPDPATRLTSTGLKWPLDGVRFGRAHADSLYFATLNRTTGRRLTITADRRILVFIAS